MPADVHFVHPCEGFSPARHAVPGSNHAILHACTRAFCAPLRGILPRKACCPWVEPRDITCLYTCFLCTLARDSPPQGMLSLGRTTRYYMPVHVLFVHPCEGFSPARHAVPGSNHAILHACRRAFCAPLRGILPRKACRPWVEPRDPTCLQTCFLCTLARDFSPARHAVP